MQVKSLRPSSYLAASRSCDDAFATANTAKQQQEKQPKKKSVVLCHDNVLQWWALAPASTEISSNDDSGWHSFGSWDLSNVRENPSTSAAVILVHQLAMVEDCSCLVLIVWSDLSCIVTQLTPTQQQQQKKKNDSMVVMRSFCLTSPSSELLNCFLNPRVIDGNNLHGPPMHHTVTGIDDGNQERVEKHRLLMCVLKEGVSEVVLEIAAADATTPSSVHVARNRFVRLRGLCPTEGVLHRVTFVAEFQQGISNNNNNSNRNNNSKHSRATNRAAANRTTPPIASSSSRRRFSLDRIEDEEDMLIVGLECSMVEDEVPCSFVHTCVIPEQQKQSAAAVAAAVVSNVHEGPWCIENVVSAITPVPITLDGKTHVLLCTVQEASSSSSLRVTLLLYGEKDLVASYNVPSSLFLSSPESASSNVPTCILPVSTQDEEDEDKQQRLLVCFGHGSAMLLVNVHRHREAMASRSTPSGGAPMTSARSLSRLPSAIISMDGVELRWTKGKREEEETSPLPVYVWFASLQRGSAAAAATLFACGERADGQVVSVAAHVSSTGAKTPSSNNDDEDMRCTAVLCAPMPRVKNRPFSSDTYIVDAHRSSACNKISSASCKWWQLEQRTIMGSPRQHDYSLSCWELSEEDGCKSLLRSSAFPSPIRVPLLPRISNSTGTVASPSSLLCCCVSTHELSPRYTLVVAVTLDATVHVSLVSDGSSSSSSSSHFLTSINVLLPQKNNNNNNDATKKQLLLLPNDDLVPHTLCSSSNNDSSSSIEETLHGCYEFALSLFSLRSCEGVAFLARLQVDVRGVPTLHGVDADSPTRKRAPLDFVSVARVSQVHALASPAFDLGRGRSATAWIFAISADNHFSCIEWDEKDRQEQEQEQQPELREQKLVELDSLLLSFAQSSSCSRLPRGGGDVQQREHRPLHSIKVLHGGAGHHDDDEVDEDGDGDEDRLVALTFALSEGVVLVKVVNNTATAAASRDKTAPLTVLPHCRISLAAPPQNSVVPVLPMLQQYVSTARTGNGQARICVSWVHGKHLHCASVPQDHGVAAPPHFVIPWEYDDDSATQSKTATGNDHSEDPIIIYKKHLLPPSLLLDATTTRTVPPSALIGMLDCRNKSSSSLLLVLLCDGYVGEIPMVPE